MYGTNRYHVMLGKRRTTVTVDKIVSAFMALKLETTPETAQAHTAVREYIQGKINENKDPERILVSQWLKAQLLLELVDTKLSKQYRMRFETFIV